MITKYEINYPHDLTVIGRSTVHKQENMEYQTRVSFQIWLQKNYIDNDNLALGLALTCLGEQRYDHAKKTYHLKNTYAQSVAILQLFENQTINLICYQ